MKKIYRVFILAAVLTFCAGFALLQYQGQRLERYQAQFFDCFDTVTTITGYAKSQEDFSQKVGLLQEKLMFYHKLYDIYHTYDGMNNIKNINDAAGKEVVKVEPEIIELLKLGRDMYEKTGGEVQIAYGSVLSLWHKYRQEGIEHPDQAELPPQEELNRRAKHTNMEKMILDEKASTVYLSDKEMSLDVGSIGKGYAVSRLAEYAREADSLHL